MEYVAVARGAKDGRTHRSVPTGCINVSLIYLWPFMPMEGHTAPRPRYRVTDFNNHQSIERI